MSNKKLYLTKQKCKPCDGIGDKLSKKQISQNLRQIKNWHLISSRITKTFKFKDFKSTLKFVNKLGK